MDTRETPAGRSPSEGAAGRVEIGRDPAARSVVAYVGEDGRYAEVADAGVDVARERGVPLILFDADAASLLASPLPTEWSAEGERQLFGDRLSPEDLVRAGRASLARSVQNARRSGVDAFGWLPSSAGSASLADYALSEHAMVVLVPEDLEHPDLADRLTGRTASGVTEAIATPVLVVSTDGDVHEFRARGTA